MVCFVGSSTVWRKSQILRPIPPGGCLGKLMQVVSRYVTVLGHLMVPWTTGDQVFILKPQIKSLIKRFDMVHAQSLAVICSPRIGAVASFVADPADVVVTIQDVTTLLLPRGSEAKLICL